jgi:uncharacterized LabA/DUF88 family protein
MSTILPSQRIAVLVDVQNMFHSAYDCFHGRLSYKELLEHVAVSRPVTRAIAFAMQDGNDQSSFFAMLRDVGFEVRTKEPRLRPDGSRKGGWDLGMAIAALDLAPKVDAIALVSGDGDFVDLVTALQARGVRAEVYAFERSVGRELREAADLFVPIGEDLIFRESHQDAPPPAGPVDEPVEEGQNEKEAKTAEPAPPAAPRSSGFGAGILTDPENE